MNAIVLTVVVQRANARQIQVSILRQGEGDDLVAERADQMQCGINKTLHELIEAGPCDFEVPPTHNEEAESRE